MFEQVANSRALSSVRFLSKLLALPMHAAKAAQPPRVDHTARWRDDQAIRAGALHAREPHAAPQGGSVI